ncbi:MAG TPA: potassium-transporting ATPase subunit KdpC [Gemmatimonadales bacterium]|nr:potassium-transporting ATPase subunit KdpC [Gemmatimonadales bacterium]
MLKNQLRPAIVLTLLLCVITGLVYPGVITAIAQAVFPHQANGSLIAGPNGTVRGSEIIGQPFAKPEYFHPRPSAAGAGYDDTLSAGTNKGPTDLKLADTLIAGAVDSAVKLDGAVKGKVPADLATSSASGLDPDISPGSAYLQVSRVARARHLDSAVVQRLVESHIAGRQFGFFGDPRVNVLKLNLALDSLSQSH